jgi:hypothetical protein
LELKYEIVLMATYMDSCCIVDNDKGQTKEEWSKLQDHSGSSERRSLVHTTSIDWLFKRDVLQKGQKTAY